MKTLTLSTSNFDREHTFRITSVKYSTCSLHRDYQKQGDGIYWAMQHGGCLSDHYSEDEIAERHRLRNDPNSQIANGEIVLIDGEEYRMKVNGNYSNAAVFEKV